MAVPPFRNLEVLVVEDEASLREIVKRHIMSFGYNATTVDSAESAMKSLEKKYYNILVSDIRLGKMDGLELGNKLREKDGALAIIFMTGKPTAKGMAAAQQVGAIQYISKPIDVATLEENLAIAARWNVAQLITRATEKYFSLRGGRMSILDNKFQRTKAEVKNIVLYKRNADLLSELAYSKAPQTTELFTMIDEKMAPFLRTM